jgi:cell wall-associated NlpC family hydrolase
MSKNLLFAAFLATAITAGCSATRPAGQRSGTGRGSESSAAIGETRKRVVRECVAWLGRDYCSGGTGGDCFDCSGLVTRVFATVGVALPRSARDMYEAGSAVRKSALLPGDLVFFRNTAGRGITHVGVYVGGGAFIHASTRRGVIRTLLHEDYYVKHWAGARRVLASG